MNQIKRQLTFTRLPPDQLKRFRGSTCFEDLPNELFYELFDYLDGCDVYQAFGKLNIRFENLLNHSLLPLKMTFSAKSQAKLEYHCRDVIIPNKHRIFSLHLYAQPLIRSFFDYCTLDESFTRLQSIILIGLSAFKLLTVLFHLNSIPSLSSLIIELEQDYYYNLSDIYRLIFHLSCLKYCKLTISDCEESDVLIPVSINGRLSTIEHLILNFPCTLKEITSLLRHTPHLQRLSCERLVETDNIDIKEEELTLTHLTNLRLVDCDLQFNDFEMFIKKINASLRILHLRTSCFTSYLDGRRWKQLMKKHMPYLNEFHFECSANTEFAVDTNLTPNAETISQLTSIFCTERSWLFEIKDAADEFVYSIHSHRKMWFDDLNHQQILHWSNPMIDQRAITTDISCHQPSDNSATTRLIQLTIEDYTTDTWDPLYIDSMKLCFTAVDFTHLSINCNGLLIGMLIDIIRLLPNLLSLKVSSLTNLQSNTLSFEDSEMLLLVSITSKITKVKLDQMDTIDQMHLLMDLCPRMQYLEVGCTTENDLEKILACISLNNNTRVLYLSCLCFCVPDSNEKIVHNLHKLIDFERLFQPETKTFRDYVIQRREKKVFLNWKVS